MALFDQLKLLYDQGLYSNVTTLASMILSVSENSPDILTFATKYQTYVYYADSLVSMKEYKKAEAMYRRALQLKKSLAKSKGKAQPFNQGEVTSEVDIKYRAYTCLINLKQYSQAIALLESIPTKQKTPCINMALAKLYHMNGMDRSAITCYKEVLKECPFAVEAAQGLLSLNVRGPEVMSLMLSGNISVANIDWLSLWIKAHSLLHAKELTQAIGAFRQIDLKTHLRDNVDVLVSLGETYYYNGDYTIAMAILEKAHLSDPLLVKGMDVYAALLFKERKTKELESLTSHVIAVNDTVHEPWIAMGYFSCLSRRMNKALNFSQKACIISPRNVEALLLRGHILYEMKKVQDSVTYFKEANKIAPYRYETHKGMVDCYVAMHRTREAIEIANGACRQLGHTARALTLYASVLYNYPSSSDKNNIFLSKNISQAKSLLEKALKQDPTYLNAVYLLATIYEQERLYEKGIELLRKHTEQQSSCKLHQMLGDFLARTNEHEKALHHFSIALNMDPSNHKSMEGAQRVENNPESSESCYEVISDSENEAELEVSEADATWSDGEYI